MSTSSTPSAKTIFEEAEAAVNGARQENYGHPYLNFSRIADYWSSHLMNRLDSPLTPEDVAIMMILLKIARLGNTPNHRDSLVDIAGYARTIEIIPTYLNE